MGRCRRSRGKVPILNLGRSPPAPIQRTRLASAPSNYSAPVPPCDTHTKHSERKPKSRGAMWRPFRDDTRCAIIPQPCLPIPSDLHYYQHRPRLRCDGPGGRRQPRKGTWRLKQWGGEDIALTTMHDPLMRCFPWGYTIDFPGRRLHCRRMSVTTRQRAQVWNSGAIWRASWSRTCVSG